MKSNILIYLGTEFHYLVALSIIREFYPSEKYSVIYLVNGENGLPRGRLSNLIFEEELWVIEQTNLQETLKKIKNKSFSQFISFLNHDPLTIYLDYYFKKRTDTKRSIAPDGSSIYTTYTPFILKSRIPLTLKMYKFFIKNGLWYPKLKFFHYESFKNTKPDFIFTFGGSVPTNNRKLEEKVVQYSISKESKKELLKVFNVNHEDLRSIPKEKVVLIIGQNYPKSELFEYKLIEEIRATNSSVQILYKKHPKQFDEKLGLFDKFENFRMISGAFPVEILISELRDSIILSAFSTSSFYKNKSCTFFWLYPLNSEYSTRNGKLKIYNPKNHINVIETFENLNEELRMAMIEHGIFEKKNVEIL